MQKPEVNINCPNCDHKIDVDEIVYQQLENDIKKKYTSYVADLKKEYALKDTQLAKQQAELAKQQQQLDLKVQESVNVQLKAKELTLRQQLKTQIQEENQHSLNILKTELQEKSEKLKELNEAKANIEKLKREKAGLREEIELENQKKISDILREEKERIAKNEHEKHELKLSEQKAVIDQLRQQLIDAQRKAEQGSMQLQGEVQELAIEEWLKSEFPLDTIDEIKKGARGADCVQTVNTYTSENCGTIYYESKRTKDFSPAWIEKFKNDIRDKGANIGVLVTDTMPKGVKRMTLIDGIWVCSFEEFKGLSKVLRENIIAVSQAVASQENKGDKMVMLYDFLTSNEFKLQIEAIVEGFTQMQADLISEKRSIQGHWKKREKQIEKVLLNTNYMYSSIKGIAGSAIKPIKSLELGTEAELFD